MLGNSTNPMRAVSFERVVVKYTDGKPHKVKPAAPLLLSNTYHCEHAHGSAVGDVPVPSCLLA